MVGSGAHGMIGVVDPPGGAATGGMVDGWVVVAGGTATGADDVGGRGDGSSEHSGSSCQLSSAGDGRGAGQSIVIKRGCISPDKRVDGAALGRSKLRWHVGQTRALPIRNL